MIRIAFGAIFGVLVAGVLAAADVKDCDSSGKTCTEATIEALTGQPGGEGFASCGVNGQNGTQIHTPCGIPPCQANATETHACLSGPCPHLYVKRCFNIPVEPCVDVPQQDCGLAETGECISTRMCTPCEEGGQECWCVFGPCAAKSGAPPTPCAPLGCGTQATP